MAFVWDRNTGKIRPTKARVSTERLYTLGEIEALARQWRDEHGFTSDDNAPWSVSHLLAWLGRREKDGEPDNTASGVRGGLHRQS